MQVTSCPLTRMSPDYCTRMFMWFSDLMSSVQFKGFLRLLEKVKVCQMTFCSGGFSVTSITPCSLSPLCHRCVTGASMSVTPKNTLTLGLVKKDCSSAAQSAWISTRWISSTEKPVQHSSLQAQVDLTRKEGQTALWQDKNYSLLSHGTVVPL